MAAFCVFVTCGFTVLITCVVCPAASIILSPMVDKSPMLAAGSSDVVVIIISDVFVVLL